MPGQDGDIRRHIRRSFEEHGDFPARQRHGHPVAGTQAQLGRGILLQQEMWVFLHFLDKGGIAGQLFGAEGLVHQQQFQILGRGLWEFCRWLIRKSTYLGFLRQEAPSHRPLILVQSSKSTDHFMFVGQSLPDIFGCEPPFPGGQGIS